MVESLVVLDIDGVFDLDDLLFDLRLSEIFLFVELLIGDFSFVGKLFKEIEWWVIEWILIFLVGNWEEIVRIFGISECNLYCKLNEYEFK